MLADARELSLHVCFKTIFLKLVNNFKGRWKRETMGVRKEPNVRFIYNLNTQLLNKNHISFSALSSKVAGQTI